MKVKTIIEERFEDYKLPSMFIGTCHCDWKCCHDGGFSVTVCQNNAIASQPDIDIPSNEIYNMYVNNKLTSAIVIGGLEPMLQFRDMFNLISYFRKHGCEDMFVIYTGYYKNEILLEIEELKQFKNIIIKFGRYVPNKEKHYDPILGVELSNDEQYAEVIS